MPPQIIGLKSCLEEIAFRCLYGNRNVMWWDTQGEKVAAGAFWNLLQLHVYCDGFDHMLPHMKLSLLNYFPWLVPLLTYIMIAYA